MTTDLALLVLRSSAVMALALAAVACLSRSSAAMRHRVLALAFCGAVMVGPLVAVVPAWPVLPSPSIALAPASTESPAGAVSPAIPQPVEAGRVAPLSPLDAALIVWALGAALAFARLAGGSWYVRRLAGQSRSTASDTWARVLDEVRAGYGLHRPVRLAVTAREGVLATFGVLKPTVLVPRSAIGWDEERVRVVLLHELAHVRRGDWLVQVFAESARAVFWFNPLFWIGCARLRRESECACDDQVLAAGTGPDRYAEHLVEIARGSRRARMPWAAVVPMARQSTLEGRVTAMLNPVLDRRTPSRLAVLASSTARGCRRDRGGRPPARRAGRLRWQSRAPSSIPAAECCRVSRSRSKTATRSSGRPPPARTASSSSIRSAPAATSSKRRFPASSRFATSWCCPRDLVRCRTSRCKSGRSRRRSE